MGLKGYNQYTGFPPPQERFWNYVCKSDGCWIWVGSRMATGYGNFGAQGLAHRFSYEMHVGAIPEGLTIDHLCRNRSCVNPGHMEVVTQAENVLRGKTIAAQNKAKESCPKGHPYDYIEACSGTRRCRTCKRENDNRRYHAKKVAKCASA